MTDERADRLKIATSLEQVADGAITAETALEQWPSALRRSGIDADLNLAWHELYHFISDADLRVRDPEAAREWRRRLREVAAAIRGADG